jgi:hypothetical protein
MKATIIQFTWGDNGKFRILEIKSPVYLINNPKAMQVVVTRAFLEMAIKDWTYLEICSEMGWDIQMNHDTWQMGNPEDIGSTGKAINWDMKEWAPHKVFFDILGQRNQTAKYLENSPHIPKGRTRVTVAEYPKILQELAKARRNA